MHKFTNLLNSHFIIFKSINSILNVKQAYGEWAKQYDTDENKTRDLEARSLREMLAETRFVSCLEIGCGTGKNTAWLANRAKLVTAVDFSEEMLAIARKKVNAGNVRFHRADVMESWDFTDIKYDLITFSLVLEHIENLDDIFSKASAVTVSDGYIYIGELHPYKQYRGSKARFETEEGEQIVTCFTHHISEFIQSAKKHGFRVENVREYFDDDERKKVPRILSILLKQASALPES